MDQLSCIGQHLRVHLRTTHPKLQDLSRLNTSTSPICATVIPNRGGVLFSVVLPNESQDNANSYPIGGCKLIGLMAKPMCRNILHRTQPISISTDHLHALTDIIIRVTINCLGLELALKDHTLF